MNRRALNAAYDDSLIDSLRGLSTRVEVRNGEVGFYLPPEAAAAFSAIGRDQLFFSVFDSEGNCIGGESDLGTLVRHSERLRLTYGRYRGEDVRIISMRLPVTTPHGTKIIYLRGAETLKGRVAAATENESRFIAQQLLMVCLVTLAVLVGVRRALRPLKSIREELAQRSLSDLRPLTVERAPVEILPLLETINQLLSHLRADFEIKQRFVSNAAHQLRTPLAGLKTSAELALREQTIGGMREMVQQILTGANRSVHLVKQLLAISRAEPNSGRDLQFVDVDVAALARESCKSYLGEALRKNIDLGYEGPVSAFVRGEATCLREMIANLIDNAIRYTQEEGVVTVHVAEGRDVVIMVEDSGPGIPSKEREHVFERFYRVLGTGEDGSGLGLAIVKEVVQMHRGLIALADGEGNKGTRFIVRLPSLARHLRLHPQETPKAA